MREVHKLINIDKPYEGTEPPDLFTLMIKCQDFVVYGIPYKKNRSTRLQNKMRKIVRKMNNIKFEQKQ